jgi:hypothetical protein
MLPIRVGSANSRMCLAGEPCVMSVMLLFIIIISFTGLKADSRDYSTDPGVNPLRIRNAGYHFLTFSIKK